MSHDEPEEEFGPDVDDGDLDFSDYDPYPSELEMSLREDEQMQKEICPHCLEPIGKESCGSNGNEPVRHLSCLKTKEERMAEVKYHLRRLDAGELMEALNFSHDLVSEKF